MTLSGGPPPTTPLRRVLRRQARNIIGFAVSAACIAFIAWQIDLRQIGIAIASFQWPYLMVGLAALALGYAIRVLRWSIMLGAAGAHTSFARCVAPFLGSIALNNVLPARLGDVTRALVFPSALGITKVASTGSLVLERLMDLATILCLLALALLAFPSATVPEAVKFSAITLAVLTAIGLVSVVAFSGLFAKLAMRLSMTDLAKHNLSAQRLLTAVHSLLLGFRAMSRPPVLIVVTLLSALVWVGEAGFFWAFLTGAGISSSLAAAALVMTIATLATLVPSSPGYVGPFHLAAYAATTILGSSPEIAVSFAVLAHAGIWLPTTLAGAIAILLNPGLFAGRRKGLANFAGASANDESPAAALPDGRGDTPRHS